MDVRAQCRSMLGSWGRNQGDCSGMLVQLARPLFQRRSYRRSPVHQPKRGPDKIEASRAGGPVSQGASGLESSDSGLSFHWTSWTIGTCPCPGAPGSSLCISGRGASPSGVALCSPRTFFVRHLFSCTTLFTLVSGESGFTQGI